MPELMRIPLPFGQGLDRETGVMAMRPGTFEDLRNMLLHQDKAIVRPGFESTVTLYDDEDNEVSHILQGHSLRSERIGVVVSYQETTDKVWVHRVDTLAATAEQIGEWENDTSAGWNETVPRVSMCEVYGRVFIAHDLASITKRASTIYYDPFGGATPLNNLEGDFKGAGTHDIRFRGVVRHLKYLFGWGYGDEDTDRPELVRVSAAGDPTTFSPEHYFIAGDRRDPVLICRPAQDRLIVYKEVEGHVILGSGRDDFAIFLLDPLYGCLGSQLAANRGGMVVAWSAEGPRVWDGKGPSAELALPLELSGAEPNDLVAEGAADTAFAAYIPDLRVMGFFFGARCYALTTRVQGDWKWDYWPLGFTPLCGFTLYPGSQDTEAPTGFPQWSAIVASGIYVDVTVLNWNQDGDETLELWLSEDGGAWYLASSELVSSAASQVIRATSLTPGTDYDGAVRYRRGTLYTPGYTDADPTNWPSISQGAFNTSIAPPTWVSGIWSRTGAATEQIALTVTPATGQEAQDIEVYRDGGLINTISGPHTGNATYDDTACVGETDEVYTFLTVGSGGDSELSDEETVWAGPPDIPEMDWALSGGDEGYEVGVILGDTADPTEVHDNYDDLGGTGAFGLRFTLAAAIITGDSGALVNLPAAPPPVTIEIKARHKETAFTTDDFSKFSDVLELDMLDHP